ncbi:MAG: bifunctional DNA-formamidopyrimidine glycosylase/DNA-(apurinic or apyrimidinic site) lyase [Gammaproteobacteria bacterium]|nr:bifunctional DNA-formamidopyrimidine glycosylase/DNA-(apurinic or apyrimidinic site) lyase [Gammaproteobacteria bacterium]
MPELPEVETIRRGIEPHVLGRRIERVTVRNRRLRWPIPEDLEARLSGRTVHATARRGKYLLLDVGEDQLMLHMGMSGRLFVLPANEPLHKHDHLDLLLSGDVLLRFHDPRRFGAALLWPKNEPEHPLLSAMGPEPFDEAFDGDYLFRRSRGRIAAVKTFLMDGRIVVGAGNIYAAEALFRAGIRPLRAAGRVSRREYQQLAEATRQTLADAIRAGGTTLRDFFGADGNPGYFQQDLYIYGREGLSCYVCGSIIRHAVIGQRSSCWCPSCQR